MIDKLLTGFLEQWKKAPLAGWLVIILFIQSNGLELLEIGVEQKAEQTEANEIAVLRSQINLLVALHQATYEASTVELKDDTINTAGITGGLQVALMVANDVYNENGVPMVVTSLNDGKHARTSLHYSGNAVDLRTKNIEQLADKTFIFNEIRGRLNIDYDVLLENVGEPGEHLHIEFQPRRRDT